MSKHRTRKEILADLNKLTGCTITEEGNSLRSIERKTNAYGYQRFQVRWSLSMLPGCCGVGVVSNTNYQSTLPKTKAEANKIRALVCEYQEAHARDIGKYGAVIQTHVVRRKEYQDTVTDREYTEALRFTNPKTRNKVTIDVKEI